MRKILTGPAWLLLALIATGSPVLAESDAIRAMASITLNLNHFPSDADKAALSAIIESDDSSEEEASIAMALMNMQHKVTERDAERLADIVDDDEADANARELAGIVLGINHSASDDDKETLAALAGE